jgi:undecaprenyl-diphosphatase
LANTSPSPYPRWSWRSPRVIAAVVIAALLTAFGMLADEVLEGDTLDFDLRVLNLFRVAGNPAELIGPAWVQEAVRDVTSLGSFSILGFITIVVVLDLLLRGKRQSGWYLAGCVIGGAILSTWLKTVFDRPRPDLPAVAKVFTASFPSGHATVSAVVFLTMGVLLAEAAAHRRLKVFYLGVAVFLTLMVGVSRVYLGVHYPTDVLAGWMLGTAWALICWAGVQFLKPAPEAPTK